MGVSGSGKTTVGKALAERIGAEFADADDHHPPENIAKMRRGEPLNDADRSPWLDRLRQRIADALDDPGKPTLVLTCSALKRAYRGVLTRPGDPIAVVFLDVDHDTLAARLVDRPGHFFNPALLEDQLANLQPPRDGEAIRIDATQPIEAVVATLLARLR